MMPALYGILDSRAFIHAHLQGLSETGLTEEAESGILNENNSHLHLDRYLETAMSAPVLTDLFLLQHYFEEAGAAIYREDFIRKYGAAELEAALSAGLIEQRCLPCRDGGAKALCRLSDKGHRVAQAMLSA